MRISDWSSDVCSSDLLCGCAIHSKKSLFRSHETTPKHFGRNKERIEVTYKPPKSATLIGVGDVMIAKYDETLLDPAAPVLQAADFTFGHCEWPYAEEMGDTHPVEAHLNDDVKGEDIFIPGDPTAVRLKGPKRTENRRV